MTNEVGELRLISKNEAAKILGVRKDKIGELIETGKIRFLKLEKRIKIPLSELKRFIEKNLMTLEKEELKDDDIFIDLSEAKSESNFNSTNYFEQLLKEK